MATTGIVIRNDIRELERIREFLEKMGDQWDLTPRDIFSLNLVLEELVTNIIFYGFDDAFDHEITVKMMLEDGMITLTIDDEGKPFDPFQVATPADLDKPIEERRIGGLGIHFVREIMDSYAYERFEGKNRIQLTKQVK